MRVRSKSRPTDFHEVKKSAIAGIYTCDCVAAGMGKECRHQKIAKMTENKEQLKINERIVRLSGMANVDYDFVMDQEAVLKVTGDVVKIEDRSRQDGTIDKVAVIKLRFIEIL